MIEGTRAVFVSPHFDDVALSCGGIVAKHAAAGDAPVLLTVFAAPPDDGPVSKLAQQIHEWSGVGPNEGKALIEKRLAEEKAAAAELGATSMTLAFKDAIYRGEQYTEESLFQEIHPSDSALLRELEEAVVAVWRQTSQAVVYLPIGIGDHVDHQLCARLHGALHVAGATVRRYEDIPYVIDARGGWRPGADWTPSIVDVTPFFEKRLRAIEHYGSQLGYLFPRGHRATLEAYASGLAGRPESFAERTWSVPC